MSVQNKGAEIYFSWSIQVIAITAIVGILILGVVYKVLNDDVNIYIKVILSVFLSSVFVFFSIKTPISIQVKNGCLVVNQLLCKKRIAVSDIRKIARLDSHLLKSANRDFGSGGFCGYVGKFSSNTMGRFVLYATELNNLVVVETANEKIVVSCNDYSRLLSMVDSKK